MSESPVSAHAFAPVVAQAESPVSHDPPRSHQRDVGLVSLSDHHAPRAHPALTIPDAVGLAALQAYGETIAASKLFRNVSNWQSAVMLIRYGQALGVDEFTALTDIYWIEGTPTASAKLMTALIERDHGGDWLLPVESTATVCEVQFKRREWGSYQTHRVTIEEYKHLRSKTNWVQSPKDMLFARLVSQIARRYFASTIKGLYTSEELDESRAIETTARVVERQSAPRPAARVAEEVERAEPPVRRSVPPVPASPPAPTDEATAIIRDNWSRHIERASTLERLDEIGRTLANNGIDDTGLQEALQDRRDDLIAADLGAFDDE